MSDDEQDKLKRTVTDAQNRGVSIKECCDAVGAPERSFYRMKSKIKPKQKRGRKTPPHNKLRPEERKEIVDILLDLETIDLSPREIYYKKLDEEQKVVASPSTFYRVAKQDNLLTKRSKTGSKNPLNREKPEIMATGINQIWSWDVSQIRSNLRNKKYYLYVIIDIWSRFVVGWILENHEQSEKAIKMWKDALETQSLTGDGLINHKDNGSIMTSKEMIKFVQDAQMVDSYSRAGVSDDNPYSEALFRTIKYFRSYPNTFATLEEGREYFEGYFHDYNYDYCHSRIQFLTPAQRHYGEEQQILSIRNKILAQFYEKNQHRYSSKHKIFNPITKVGIN